MTEKKDEEQTPAEKKEEESKPGKKYDGGTIPKASKASKDSSSE